VKALMLTDEEEEFLRLMLDDEIHEPRRWKDFQPAVRATNIQQELVRKLYALGIQRGAT